MKTNELSAGDVDIVLKHLDTMFHEAEVEVEAVKASPLFFIIALQKS